ncbi:MAG: cytochrome P450, partial [Mycobacterium sp.]
MTELAGGTIPDTIVNIDLADGTFYADGPQARAAYRWMRANQPVFRDRNGLAGATTYQAIIDAERNPELFSSTGGIRPDQPGMPYMIDMDDPAHLVRRKLVNAGFTRKRVREKEPSIARLCDMLIDAVCERGECDFVRDIAAPLPMAVIGDMLGVLPEERGMLLKWSDDLVTGLSSHIDPTSAEFQAVMDAFAAYTEFTMDLITKRRAEPTDDLFSILVNAEVEGQRMSDDEIVLETLLILIGGDETTRHTLSGGTEQLVRNADQWERLHADASLLPGAIEEMLRWTSPVKNMCRTLTADTEFHGTQLQQGEKIMLLFESA